MKEDYSDIKKGDILYYVRLLPNINENSIVEMKVNSTDGKSIIGYEKDGFAVLVAKKYLGNRLYKEREAALRWLREYEEEQLNKED